MKKRMKRLAAMLLAVAMVVQQGSTLGVLAVETEPVSEKFTELTGIDQEPETKIEEMKAPETQAPETKVEETKAPEALAPEMKSEETELPPQNTLIEETVGETSPESEQATEPAAEPATEQASEVQSEPITETVTEEVTEAASETVTEAETEKETETEEAVVLETSVMQEVFQKTVEDSMVPMVKYTVKIANKAEKKVAEGVSLKVLLADELFYKKEAGETQGLVSFETLGKAIEAATFGNELTEENKTVYANGGVVLWRNQTIAAGEEKTFVFCAEVKDGQTDVNALKNLWFVNSEAVAVEKIQWANAEQLEVVEKELPSEFVCSGEDGMTVTAVVSDPSVFPEGTVLVAEPMEVTAEDLEAMRAELDENKVLLNVVQYDIRFEHDGQEIEPPDGVTVEVSIAQKEIREKAEASNSVELQIQHIMDSGEVEYLPTNEATVLENGEIREASFTTESFSPFRLMLLDDKAPIEIKLEGEKLDENGSFYVAISGNDKHIVKKVEVKNGKITPNIKVDQLYDSNNKNTQDDGTPVYPKPDEKYSVKVFENPKNGIPEETKADSVQNIEGYREIKEGSFILGSCLVKDIPEDITLTGTDDALTIKLDQKGTTLGSYSAVESLLGLANDFGVFTMTYDEDVHTEATIVADTVKGTIQSQFNFSSNNYNRVNNTITITKTYTKDGEPYAEQNVEINLYREGSKYPVAHLIGKTDASGKCELKAEHLTSGTYYFYEMLNGEEVKTSGTITVNGQQIDVTYNGNEGLDIVTNGYFNYSYFNHIDADEDLNGAEKGSFVVLGEPAWTNYYNKVKEAWDAEGANHTNGVQVGKLNQVLILDENTIYIKEHEATVVKAGTNGFDVIDIPGYFAQSGPLQKASTDIAHMKSGDAVVYYLKPSDLTGYNFSSDGGKYIIVNVDMSGMENSYTYPGQYTIDGQSIKADFVDERSSRILWNFYDYENDTPYVGTLTQGGMTTGVVLAPCCDVFGASGNLGGTMIAKSYTHSAGEIHQIQPDVTSATASGEVTNEIGAVAKSVVVEFSGLKAVENGSYQTSDSAAGYTFKVELVDNKGVEKTDPNVAYPKSVVSKEDGTFRIDSVKFKEAGTYYFKLTEKKPTKLDTTMKYDESVYYIEVVVAEDSAAAKGLSISSVKVRKGETGEYEPVEGSSPYSLTGAAATFTNERLHGKLAVEKKVEGESTESDDVEYTVKVTADAGTYVNWQKVVAANTGKGLTAVEDGVTFKLKANENVTLEGLPFGTYTVTETDTVGKPFSATYKVGETKTNKVTVGKDSDTAVKMVTITNTYTEEKGSLKVKKLFKGLSEEQIKNLDKFVITVKNESGETVATLELKAEDVIPDKVEKGFEWTVDNLTPGTYTVTETGYTVDGYDVVVTSGKATVRNGTVKVEVTAGDTPTKAELTNTYTKKWGSLKITKRFSGLSVEQIKGLTKFVIKVTDAKGKLVKELTLSGENVTTGADGKSFEWTLDDLLPGTYTVTETGYMVEGYTIEVKGETVVVEDETASVKAGVTAGDTPAEAELTNAYVENTSIVLGATKVFDKTLTGDDFTFKLEELNADGTVKTGGVSLMAMNKADGTISFAAIPYTEKGIYYYQISELIPTGAEKDAAVLYDTTVKKVTVTVEEKDGRLTATADVAAKDIIFTNRLTSVKVSKVDVATGAELEGAHIQILDKDGNVVEEWDSTKEAHEVKGLKTGETYTLKETVAPDGYTLTAETTFTLKEDGTVDSGKTTTNTKDGVLLVEDSFNKVSILKVDESGEALKGAKLVIKDKDGKAVGEPWTTDGKTHDITGLAKGSYTLSEIEAPEGYQVSADVPFEITGKEAAGQTIEVKMTDRKVPKSATYSLTVTKNLRLDGITSDIGIRDAVFYVALFSDEAKTQRVSSVKQIVFKNQISSSVTFDNLSAGTYYVGETDENGTLLISKMVNDRIIFYPEYTGEGKVLLEGDEKNAVADFTNVYVEFTDDLYLSGQLKITKKILINGEEGTSDATYYAGVFNSPDMSEPLEIVPLELGGGSSTSYTVTNLPIGNTIGSSMTYYVTETDENGVPLDPDVVTEFEVSVDKSEIILDANNSRQEVVITNSFTEEETETETEVPKKEAPKTGDDTDFMRYLLMMALSAGVCAVAFEEKRRKARRVRK